MKKAILLLFIPLVFGCSKEQKFAESGSGIWKVKTVLVVYPDKIETLYFTDVSLARFTNYEKNWVRYVKMDVDEFNKMENKNGRITPSYELISYRNEREWSQEKRGNKQVMKKLEIRKDGYYNEYPPHPDSLYVRDSVRENLIYMVKRTEKDDNTFSLIEYNNDEFDLYSVWDFKQWESYHSEQKPQNFIFNKTGKDLFLETVVYGEDFIRNPLIKESFEKMKARSKTIKIMPNKAVAIPLHLGEGESNLPHILFGKYAPGMMEVSWGTSARDKLKLWLRY